MKYLVNYGNLFPYHIRIPFEIENQIWQRVENPVDKPDVIPVDYCLFHSVSERGPLVMDWKSTLDVVIHNVIQTIKSFYVDEKIAIMVLHSTDDQVSFETYFSYIFNEFEKHFPNKTYIIHPFKNIKQYTLYDIYFNYAKAYYHEYERCNLHTVLGCDYSSKENFKINRIQHRDPNSARLFLCASRILYDQNGEVYQQYPKLVYRYRLLNFLQNKDCYISDFKNGIILPGETEESNNALRTTTGNGQWIPVANSLYNNSYISTYVETTITNDQELITEKTFDPLIKGHFIVPFGYAGIIRDLKYMGFLFPDWIDYSYDSVMDIRERFGKFRQTLMALSKTPRKTIDELFSKDMDILKHNQNLFKKKSYDPLHNKLK
jgi:hypothetical protein